MNITESQLRNIVPHCRYPEEWTRPLSQACERFEINTVPRIAAFLGQVAVESAELNRVEENLIYSPQRIVAVWPSRFASVEAALPYGRNPEKLANRVYANRMGNGPESSGDGFRYRGRGLIQVTGRGNYERVGNLLDLPSLVQQPDKLVNKKFAALSAAAFWADKKLNEIVDQVFEKDLERCVRLVTKTVNGGEHGLAQRLAFTSAAVTELDEGFDV